MVCDFQCCKTGKDAVQQEAAMAQYMIVVHCKQNFKVSKQSPPTCRTTYKFYSRHNIRVIIIKGCRDTLCLQFNSNHKGKGTIRYELQYSDPPKSKYIERY